MLRWCTAGSYVRFYTTRSCIESPVSSRRASVEGSFDRRIAQEPFGCGVQRRFIERGVVAAQESPGSGQPSLSMTTGLIVERLDPNFTRARDGLVEHVHAMFVRIEYRFVGNDALDQRRHVAAVVKEPDLAALDSLHAHAEPAQRNRRGVGGIVGDFEADRHGS